MSCNHWCLRNSWCTSTNFIKPSEENKKGVCELNKHGDIDENSNVDYQKGATFSMLLKEHHLPCAEGLIGSQCQYDTEDCATNPCLNGGSCQGLVNGFKCYCPEGYFGKMCETV
ncbi:protein jagged-1b-like isoform X2 [Stylophora pistillata]|uniref:protein jagged-1b-like isoform X2 n=1 Tax=Stylophora pistillata TaxID=50429 RepID=UPI000C0471E2|nr:protein jagged-1b-like isoform X2 [Stylophora pistillata]